jgi:hypothetical protein
LIRAVLVEKKIDSRGQDIRQGAKAAPLRSFTQNAERDRVIAGDAEVGYTRVC